MSAVIAPRVLTLVGSHDGSAMWRVYAPAAELQRQGYTVDWARNDDDFLALAAARYDYSCIMLDRLSWTEAQLPMARAWIETFHRRNIGVLASFDDDAWTSIDEHLTEEIDRERLARNQASVSTLALVDGVVVSTQRLATIARTLTDRPVVVVPNLIDLAWFRAVQAKATRVVPPLTIGWAGAKRQDADLYEVAEAWRRVARRYERVRFVVQGYAPPPLVEAVPADRLTVLPFMPLDQYPTGLVNIDIMCCSVANVRFNRAKSNIKVLEAGARGKTAVVATPTLYGSIIRDHDTGYLAETADEWEAALSRLVEDGRLRRALARRLGREVENEYSLQRFAYRWLEAWDFLIESWKEREKGKIQLWVPGRQTA